MPQPIYLTCDCCTVERDDVTMYRLNGTGPAINLCIECLAHEPYRSTVMSRVEDDSETEDEARARGWELGYTLGEDTNNWADILRAAAERGRRELEDIEAIYQDAMVHHTNRRLVEQAFARARSILGMSERMIPMLTELETFVQTDQQGGETLKGQRAEARMVLGTQFEAVLSIDLVDGTLTLLIQNRSDKNKVRTLVDTTLGSALRPIL